MTRFNVGDRVTVRAAEYLREHAAHGCADQMLQYCGTTVTIASASINYYRIAEDDGEWNWGDTDFVEGAEEMPQDSAIDNKEKLKEKWGSYCDTDKLVDDMMALLTKYNHRNTEKGVCKVLHEYFTNKKSLIDMFKTSPRYMGDMRIMLDVEIARENSSSDIYRFCNNFADTIKAKHIILKYIDSNGKKMGDYLKCGIKSVTVQDLFNQEMMDKLKTSCDNLSAFRSDGSTVKSYDELSEFAEQMNKFKYCCYPTIDSERSKAYTIEGKYKIAEGMKTSRAFNRICAYYGVDKAKEYNKLFAQYADMVAGGTRKLKFFMSLNPIDYLTMSFGVSWASCHTIDKQNRRHMPNDYSGMYCGGTMSYMLDSTSIITFVHDHVPTDWEDGKIYRDMFHFQDNMLVQGRIYPQGNDGNTDLYKVFRNYVQDELTGLLGLESGVWVKKSGGCGGNTLSTGAHYRDYTSFSECNVSYPKEKPEATDSVVNIGHEPMCPACGNVDRSISSGQLSHGHC